MLKTSTALALLDVSFNTLGKAGVLALEDGLGCGASRDSPMTFDDHVQVRICLSRSVYPYIYTSIHMNIQPHTHTHRSQGGWKQHA